MNDYPLTLLYDGSCPICQLQMSALMKRDHASRLRFIDAAAPGFDAGKYGFKQEEFMRHIHAIRPDGSIVKGVEVMDLAYRSVGLGWLTAASRLPALKPLFNHAYTCLANNRYRISTKIPGLLAFIAGIHANRIGKTCIDGSCSTK